MTRPHARAKKPARAPGRRISSDTARFVMFCAFVAAVFAMGGGSRADILSLVVLRPIALLVAGYALACARPGDLRRVRWPLGLLTCLAAIIAAQLVPLPPSVWTALPDRELYARIASDAALAVPYRPLTLSTSRTLNALFSLSVPLAAVLITAVQEQRHRTKVFVVLLVGCAASALIAIAQLAGPSDGPLYLYSITNNGFAVGLLANRNHQALLMVVLLILLAHYRIGRLLRGSGGKLADLVFAFAALVVFALILVAGSRAGLILAILAVPMIAGMYWRTGAHSASGIKLKRSHAWAAGIAVVFLLLAGLAAAFSRAASLQRLWAGDPANDYRVERLPILLDMLREHWLAGIGFGAFEGVFQRYETLDVLTPFTFNEAHSDWIQFPMEGGLPAAVLLLAVVFWLLLQLYRLVGSPARKFDRTRASAIIVLVLIGLASLVDYPLRTPIFMLIGAVAFTELSIRARSEKVLQE